jgi:hypothetical protein
MGLDMYFTGRKSKNWNAPKIDEDGFKIKATILDLGYFRKHSDLHGFIVHTFADGVDECQVIELNKEKIQQIVQATKDKKLPHTTGFFFGASTEEDDVETLETMDKIIKWLDTPDENHYKSVSYQASW